MRRKSRRIGPFTKSFAVLAVLGALLASGIAAYHAGDIYLWGKGNETVYLPGRLVVGSTASALIFTTDAKGNPISTEFAVEMERANGPVILSTGRTGRDGWGEAEFTVPNASGETVISITSAGGTVERRVYIDSTVRLLLTTDKPIYQPGQIVHVRVVAFEGEEPAPSNDPCAFEVRSPDGDLIFRKELALNEYGIGALDYPLAYVLPFGAYKLNATIADSTASTIFVVKRYVLPKFDMQLLGMKGWYKVDERIEGAVAARYLFGREVQGNAEITAKVYRGVWEQIGCSRGALSNGAYPFSFDPVGYAVGIPVTGGMGYLELNVSVTDTSGHSEQRSTLVPLAAGDVIITVLAEGNMEGTASNYVFLARRPDGTPVEGAVVEVQLDYGDAETFVTNERGVAEASFDYHGEQRLTYKVREGATTHEEGYIDLKSRMRNLKVIPDKRRYEIGEEMRCEIRYQGDALTTTAYYEVLARGFVVHSGRTALSEGRGLVMLTASHAMAPVAEVRVYKIAPDLSVLSDSTVISVGEIETLNLSISSSQGVYKPRDTAKIDFQVTKDGEPIHAAIGVSGVDAAVFELAERMTGFEALFFDLEAEFLQPRYQICDYVYGGAERLSTDSKNQSVVDIYTDKGLGMESSWHTLLANAGRIESDAVGIFTSALLILAGMGLILLLFMAARYKAARAVIAALFMIGLTLGLALALYVSTSSYMAGSSAGGGAPGGNRTAEASPPSPIVFDQDSMNAEYSTYLPQDVQITMPEIVRQYFPETWIWEPALITDENGRASLQISVPDSITTWEIAALATSMDGSVGSARQNITVFQEFFVEPDIPVSAVRNDEFPLRIMVYNYLEGEMNVTVVLMDAEWFEALDGTTRDLMVGGGSVSSTTFTIKPTQVGTHNLTVLAGNMETSDMVVREMRIDPDGKERRWTLNAILENEDDATLSLAASPVVIPGSQSAVLRLEAGIEALTLDCAADYIQFVSGCGEQSTSRLSVDIAAYRNLLISGVADEKMAEYEMIITQGIQHELIYLMKPIEAPGRAICWHVGEPADLWLTAWALFAFQDLKIAGFAIDSAIISDLQEYVVSQQSSDGHFELPDVGHWSINSELLGKDVAATSYIVRAMLYSEYPSSNHAVQQAVEYIGSHLPEASGSAYTLALTILSLRMAGWDEAALAPLAEDLSALGHRDPENGTVHWELGASSQDWRCTTATETTAYAAMALWGMNGHEADARGAVKYLLLTRSGGCFGSTHDTAVAFQALNTLGTQEVEWICVEITSRGAVVANESISPNNSDIPRTIDLTGWIDPTGIAVEAKSWGAGSIIMQMVYVESVPWSEVSPDEEELSLTVTYDATSVQVEDMIACHVTLRYNGAAPVLKMVLIDLRCPVGFSFVTEDFDALLENGTINQYEIRDRQAVVYVDDVEHGVALIITYRIKADMPIRGVVQGVRAYDMYNPDLEATLPPVNFTSLNPPER
ncbi:MAG: alpha-2-macroglobulin family protein [Candidatus Thermoplasmatota archaeon]